MKMRHTMGYDSSAYRQLNPPNAKRISRKQIEDLATQHGISIKRDGIYYSYLKGEVWMTLGVTNYLAFMHLQEIIGDKASPR